MSKSTDRFLETNESEEVSSGYEFTFNAGYYKDFTLCDDEPSTNKTHLLSKYIKEMIYNFSEKVNNKDKNNSNDKKIALTISRASTSEDLNDLCQQNNEKCNLSRERLNCSCTGNCNVF